MVEGGRNLPQPRKKSLYSVVLYLLLIIITIKKNNNSSETGCASVAAPHNFKLFKFCNFLGCWNQHKISFSIPFARMAFRFYSRGNSLSIISSIHHIPPIDNATWRVLKDNGTVKTITRHGCRAGLAIQRSKLRSFEGSSTLQASRLSSYENSFCTNTEIQDDLELNLHNTSLNIHANTLAGNAVHSQLW